MGRAEAGSTKAIANAIKAKGESESPCVELTE